MSIRQNHIRATQLMICAGCLVVAGSGQAQKPAMQSQVHQNITLRGPIRVDTSEPTLARTGPVYMLSLVESQLPKGASVLCTNRYIPGPDSTATVDINTAAGLHDFTAYCRGHEIRFEFGIPF